MTFAEFRLPVIDAPIYGFDTFAASFCRLPLFVILLSLPTPRVMFYRRCPFSTLCDVLSSAGFRPDARRRCYAVQRESPQRAARHCAADARAPGHVYLMRAHAVACRSATRHACRHDCFARVIISLIIIRFSVCHVFAGCLICRYCLPSRLPIDIADAAA